MAGRRGERGPARCCSLHPACLFPALKLAAACRMQMEKMQFVGKCPLINNLGVFSLSGSDILHFSSLPHQPKTFNDVVLLPGRAAHAKYLQPHKMVGGEPGPAPAPRPAPLPGTSPLWRGGRLSAASPARPGGSRAAVPCPGSRSLEDFINWLK